MLIALDPGELAASLGVDQSWVEKLGIHEFSRVKHCTHRTPLYVFEGPTYQIRTFHREA